MPKIMTMSILKHPDPILLRPCNDRVYWPLVFNLDGFVENMFEAMVTNKGIGLAANQVGSSLRIAVLHVPGWPKMVMCNLELLKAKGTDTAEEGCLSVPGTRVRVTRPMKVWVTYQDETGKEKMLKAQGLLARAIQHELDHLNGLTCLERTGRKSE